MNAPANITGTVPISAMNGDTPDETARLFVDCQRARDFMLAMNWCPGLGEVYFGAGLGGVVSIFLVEVAPQPTGVDRWLWVIVGDIPSAYLVLDAVANPVDALRAYISLMQEWVDLAHAGKTSDEVIPVNIDATPENAARLEARLKLLTNDILPWLVQGAAVQ